MSKTRNYFLFAAALGLTGAISYALLHDAKNETVTAIEPNEAKPTQDIGNASAAQEKSDIAIIAEKKPEAAINAKTKNKFAGSHNIIKVSETARPAPKPKTVAVVAEAPVAVQPVNPYLAYRNTNPYLVNQPVNPFFASQASNPYLAYRYEKPSPSTQTAVAPGNTRPAASLAVAQTQTMSKISFAPMPMTMYLQPNQRPTMAIATPCSAMEKMTGNNPMFKMFEQMAFGMIGSMNEAGFMPMIIEPVCT